MSLNVPRLFCLFSGLYLISSAAEPWYPSTPISEKHIRSKIVSHGGSYITARGRHKWLKVFKSFAHLKIIKIYRSTALKPYLYSIDTFFMTAICA